MGNLSDRENRMAEFSARCEIFPASRRPRNGGWEIFRVAPRWNAGYFAAASFSLGREPMRIVSGFVLGMFLVAPTAAAQDAAKAAQGQKVYTANKCGTCHSIGGKGNKKGPLDEVGSKLTEAEIREWIVSPKEMTKKTNAKRKPIMKEHPKLTPDEVDALVAYMQTLKKG
jgi:mono/diheme cytochrome c family protein